MRGTKMSRPIRDKWKDSRARGRIHSFIHIKHLYSASSRKLLRSAPNTSTVKQSRMKEQRMKRERKREDAFALIKNARVKVSYMYLLDSTKVKCSTVLEHEFEYKIFWWIEQWVLWDVVGWWRFGRVNAFPPKGRGFESRSSRHVGTLGKSFTHSCLWRFLLCRERLWIVEDLNSRYRNGPNEWVAPRRPKRGHKIASDVPLNLGVFLSLRLIQQQRIHLRKGWTGRTP